MFIPPNIARLVLIHPQVMQLHNVPHNDFQLIQWIFGGAEHFYWDSIRGIRSQTTTAWVREHGGFCKRGLQWPLTLKILDATWLGMSWVNYNISLTWIKAILGWFPLLTMIIVRSQWGRDEIYPGMSQLPSILGLAPNQLGWPSSQ